MEDFINDAYIKRMINSDFIKYGITGVFNTLHHYVWFISLSQIVGYTFANVIGFILANIASYIINSVYTFKVIPSLKSFMKFPSVMIIQAVISYIVPIICSVLVPQGKFIVPILTTIINFPIGFLLIKRVLLANGH